MADSAPQSRRAPKVSGGKALILAIRLASGAVDAVESAGFWLGCLWRILVSQPLEPSHHGISHPDQGEAVDRARQAGGADSLLDGTYAKGDCRLS